MLVFLFPLVHIAEDPMEDRLILMSSLAIVVVDVVVVVVNVLSVT